MKSPLKKVESEKALLERISLAIPGFRGYKQKEMRREADRLIRDHIYRKLSSAKSDLREVLRQLAANRITGIMAELDRVIAKLDRVAELIHHAPHGYAGFFNAVKVDEEDLERMMEFDLKMVDGTNEIEAMARGLKEEAVKKNFEAIGDGIGELERKVDGLEGLFSGRTEVIMGVEL
ncbi:MAG: hypothetical protein QW567_02360 [Candidatus Hadarchaeales archaeon]